MEQIPTMRSSLGEEDLTQSWLIGPTRSFLFWNSSVHQIKDGITENGGGTRGSFNVKSFNDNMNELHVIESKRNAIRKGLNY